MNSQVKEYLDGTKKLNYDGETIKVNGFIYNINELDKTKVKEIIANTATKTDYKALSHSLRIAEEVKELLETEFIEFPLRNSKYIREIKEGKHDVEKTIDEIRDILTEVDLLLLKSELPEEANQEEIEKYLIELLSKKWNKEK